MTSFCLVSNGCVFLQAQGRCLKMATNTRARKRKRSASLSQPRSEPEEQAVDEPSATLTRTDLMCPICFDLFSEVYSTQCGHSFCFQCISVAVRQAQQCPVCKAAIPGPSALHPNCSLNDVVAKFRSQAAASQEAAKGSHRVADILSLTAGLSQEELHTLLRGIAECSRHSAEQEQQVNTAVVHSFLVRVAHKKEKELERVKRELAVVYADLDRLAEPQQGARVQEGGQQGAGVQEGGQQGAGVQEGGQQGAGVREGGQQGAGVQEGGQQGAGVQEGGQQGAGVQEGGQQQRADSLQALGPSGSPLSDPSLAQPSPSSSCQSAAWSGLVAKRNLRVEANFEEILDDYLSTNLPAVGEPPDSQESLLQISEGLQKFTKFNSFRELATLTYGDQTSNCCIVSSIEFDRDGEFFAVAGVTKKIKVFEYQSVVRNTGFTNHFPVHEMTCAAKLSCVAYNPYHKHHLVSSDYEGCVCVWDTNVGRRTALHQEHGRRVWSVAYNPQEPTLFASGSDDCTVKLWSMGQPNSIFSFSAKANICSVKFNPYSRYLLAYGSADHGVHYVDLRSPNQPLLELQGHEKAVSYVNFIGPNELVSASTDSELKCWHTERGVCLRTYRGHTNDKNFVGLTVTPDYIACGSENNAVYVYSKQVSSPMLTYQYNSARGLLPSSAAGEAGQPPEPNEFVSAVSWRSNSNVLLAANSQGHIKVLEMC